MEDSDRCPMSEVPSTPINVPLIKIIHEGENRTNRKGPNERRNTDQIHPFVTGLIRCRKHSLGYEETARSTKSREIVVHNSERMFSV